MREVFEWCLAIGLVIVFIGLLIMAAKGVCAEQENKTLKIQIKNLKAFYLPRVDKNGKQVQKGDIIRYSFYSDGELVNDDFVIQWKDEDFSLGWICKPLSNSNSLFDMFPQEDFSKYITIIGNIYDNPIHSGVSE